MIRVAIPKVDKLEDEITEKEFDLETINLGPPTTDHALEDMNDKVKTVHDMLNLEVEKNSKLEKENNILKGYLQQLRVPLKQRDPSTSLSLLPPPDTIDDFEKMKAYATMVTPPKKTPTTRHLLDHCCIMPKW